MGDIPGHEEKERKIRDVRLGLRGWGNVDLRGV
jgi:hypothetical protein